MTEVRIQGIAASEGIAIGPAYCFVPNQLTIPARIPDSPEQEISRFVAARLKAQEELQSLQELVSRRASKTDAAIFEAHQMMLDDPLLEEHVIKAIQQGSTVEEAVRSATQEIATMIAGMQNEYLAARAADVQDVGHRILRILLGLPEMGFNHLAYPHIIIAEDLTPSDTASLDAGVTLGFCTSYGGLTSHTAILARTLGIPAVVGVGQPLMEMISTGTDLVLDGTSGTVIIAPSQETKEHLQANKIQQAALLIEMKAHAQSEAFTSDGKRVEVAANIGDAESAKEAVEYGAEGVGLLRTEFIYLNETQPPSETKQISAYKEILQSMGNRPVIIRTLDIGGDKPLPYLSLPDEMNPFLGWRAIRICLAQVELFKTQLRSILRAGVGHDVRMMFPMIISLEELISAKNLLREVEAELEAEGLPYAEDIQVGIMVETPAAAVLVDILSKEADFFSLGTNDLTQYTLAVDRGNPKVAPLFQPLHPALLRLIKLTIETAHANARWVGMCGELAGMSKAIPILIGMGLDEFSMASRSIPQAKRLISRLDSRQTQQIAASVLEMGTAAEVESFMDEILKSIDLRSD